MQRYRFDQWGQIPSHAVCKACAGVFKEWVAHVRIPLQVGKRILVLFQHANVQTSEVPSRLAFVEVLDGTFLKLLGLASVDVLVCPAVCPDVGWPSTLIAL